MQTKELAELIKDLPEKEQLAILGVIDLKVESEMQKVIEQLKQIEKGLNFKINVLLAAITLLALLVSLLKIFS